MPVYNAPLPYLQRAIETVRQQVYKNWELCIADDASTSPDVISYLQGLVGKPQFKLIFRPDNGHICRATNSAAGLATGDFLVFLDQDDELTPDALGELALYAAGHPETDMIYPDTDKIDGAGRRYDLSFKPDWSPELLLSYMYCGQWLSVRRTLFEKIGGSRPGFEGSQDHDLALRTGEVARHVGHIPKILYHWRCLPGSTALSGNEKPYSIEAGRRAVQEALERRGSRGRAIQPAWAVQGANSLFIHEFPDDGPSVTIIIPTKDRVDLLDRCLKSLNSTTYKNYSILVVDNESREAGTLSYLRTLENNVLRLPSPEGKFNFSHINNEAARAVQSDFILFLNNDTEVLEPRWLSSMMGYAQLKGVGAVGALLHLADGRIQHAGVIHGLHEGLCGHAFKLLPGSNRGYQSHAAVARNYSAVTAACLLTPRSLFLALQGFDEKTFAVAYNDADYCYRLGEAGHRVVYCPTSRLTHNEGATRGFVDHPAEPAAYRQRYGRKRDPYNNPNLSLENERATINARHALVGNRSALRVLFFTHNLNWEGAPKIQLELAATLKRQKIVDPIIFSPCDGPLRKDYQANGIRVLVHGSPLFQKTTVPHYQNLLSSLGKTFKDHSIDMVHANTLQTFYAVDAARLFNLPSIWSIHESEPWKPYFSSILSPEIAERAYQCFSFPYRIIFAAESTRRGYAELNSKYNFQTIRTIPEPTLIETGKRRWPRDKARKRLGIPEGDLMILLLGTVCERKGQHDLPQALARLKPHEYQNVKIFIVGARQTTYSDELKKLVRELPKGAAERVRVIEETHETAPFYQAADLFVCCSRVECYPRVTLEALAHGLPIISTPVQGLSEQLKEGLQTIFYRPGDIEGLAQALKELISNTDKRRAYSLVSKPSLQALPSFNDMISQYSEVFQEGAFCLP